MTLSIVVARFNENVEWTKLFPNVIVYNKGDKLTDEYNQVLLKNVGRESHTYYYHICENYDNLDDYIIFLQGNPFDHSPNILLDLNKYIANTELTINFEFLSRDILNCNLSGCFYHEKIPMIEIYEKLFNEKKNDLQFIFGAGAQFIVSKKSILKRPKEFYNKILEILENSTNPIDPIEGYVIERFHGLIFE